jgi:hypothetical protein
MQANLFFRIPFGVTQSDVFYAITGYNIAYVNFIEIKPGKFENFAHIYLEEWNPAQYHMFNSLKNPSGSTLKLYMPWGKQTSISELRPANQRARSHTVTNQASRVDEFGRDNDMRMRHHLSNISVKRVPDEQRHGDQSLLNTNHLPPNVTDNRRQRKQANRDYYTPNNKPRDQNHNAPQKAAKHERLSAENIASMQEIFRFANEQIENDCNIPINLPIAPTLSHVVSEHSENNVDELCDAVSELTIDDSMRDFDEHDNRRTKFMDLDKPEDFPPNIVYPSTMPVRRRVIRLKK